MRTSLTSGERTHALELAGSTNEPVRDPVAQAIRVQQVEVHLYTPDTQTHNIIHVLFCMESKMKTKKTAQEKEETGVMHDF